MIKKKTKNDLRTRMLMILMINLKILIGLSLVRTQSNSKK